MTDYDEDLFLVGGQEIDIVTKAYNSLVQELAYPTRESLISPRGFMHGYTPAKNTAAARKNPPHNPRTLFPPTLSCKQLKTQTKVE